MARFCSTLLTIAIFQGPYYGTIGLLFEKRVEDLQIELKRVTVVVES
jgi:hypothetical protein